MGRPYSYTHPFFPSFSSGASLPLKGWRKATFLCLLLPGLSFQGPAQQRDPFSDTLSFRPDLESKECLKGLEPWKSGSAMGGCVRLGVSLVNVNSSNADHPSSRNLASSSSFPLPPGKEAANEW